MFKLIGRIIVLFIATCVLLGLPLAIVWSLLEWDYTSLFWICLIVAVIISLYGKEMNL